MEALNNVDTIHIAPCAPYAPQCGVAFRGRMTPSVLRSKGCRYNRPPLNNDYAIDIPSYALHGHGVGW